VKRCRNEDAAIYILVRRKILATWFPRRQARIRVFLAKNYLSASLSPVKLPATLALQAGTMNFSSPRRSSFEFTYLHRNPAMHNWDSWNSWYPFRSQEAKEICAHLTAVEKRRASAVGAIYGVGISVIFQSPMYLATAGFLSVTWMWITMGVLISVTLFVSFIYMPRWSRRFLCNTEWARANGYNPDELALYDVRFGMKHLLALMTVVAVAAALVSQVLNR
jgi:hypothetical protein